LKLTLTIGIVNVRTNFIHAKAQTLACSLCGMTEDESPDSRVNEIKENEDVR
jgi:hypothetical protein